MTYNSALNFLRACWIRGVSLIMMIGLDQFLYAQGAGPEPKYVAILIFLTSIALFGLSPLTREGLKSPIISWLALYVMVSLAWFLLARDWASAMVGFSFVISTTLYVIAAYLMFKGMQQNNSVWIILFWSALIISVLSIVAEAQFPEFYVFSDVGSGIRGRAAGFFLNPNSAASAVVMILGCILVRGSHWGNLAASLLAFSGVLLTYSRGGIVVWALLVMLSAVRGQFPRFTVPLAAVGGGFLISILTFDDVVAWLNLDSQNSLDRLAWLLGLGDTSDHAASDRQWIARFAWNEFLASPVYGHGLGYTWIWGPEINTHNMILRHLVEYGIIGLFIFPMFLACGIWSSNPAEPRRMRWLVAAIMLITSFFSHNLLDQGRFIFSWLAFCMAPSGLVAATGLTRQPPRLLHDPVRAEL